MKLSSDQIESIRNILFRFPAMIGYWDKNLKNKFSNQAYGHFFGLSPDEMSKIDLKKALGEDVYKNNLHYIEGVLSGKEQFFEREIADQDGVMRIFQVLYHPDINDGEVAGFYVLINDLTELKKTQQEKDELYQKLIQSSKMIALGEMAGGIAHEINNPLSVINMNAKFAQDLIDDYNLDRNKLQSFVSNIQMHCKRIEKIVTGLQFFAQERPQAPFIDYPLSTIIEDTMSFCLAKIEARKISFIQSKISPDLTIKCNPVQISQVLLNLLNNSLDSLGAEEEKAKWLSLVVKEQESFVEIFVVDSGAGVPSEIVDRIMQPFVSGKATGKGSGLGLSISKGIAEQHGGTLRFDRYAKNTTFILTLPKRIT